MRAGRNSGWRTAGALAALAIVSAIGALAPVGASATDSDLKHAYAFKVDASNGYSILAYAGNERADGRGEIVLFVGGKSAGVTYQAPALLTATSVEADLGSLGEVSLDVIPSGKKKRLRSSCGGEPETATYEPQRYRGTFEFHGEEKYTEAVTSAPREYTRFFFRLLCGGVISGETGGPDSPGARLRLHSRTGPIGLDLQANKNRPGARTRFEVDLHEKRDGIAISRHALLRAGADAFDYDPLLRSATLTPPAPFAGRASFRRAAAVANRWTGNLTVDLPGRSDVPLTGAAVGATLVPSCWHEGGGGFSLLSSRACSGSSDGL
ncbi:MAG: hypothetical protein WA862_00360 [Solirubrobacterales bacterium]